MARLSPRSRELVTLLICGLTIKEAASYMDICHGAARKLLMKARIKLGCRTAWQLLYELGMECNLK